MKLKNLLLVYNKNNQLLYTLDKNLISFNQLNNIIENDYYINNSNNILVNFY